MKGSYEKDNLNNYIYAVHMLAELISETSKSGTEYSWLLDVSEISSASIEVRAINDQGRRSDPVPFDLKAKPKQSTSIKLIRQ